MQKPTKMIAEKGVKRVGTAVSQEKGVKRVGTTVSQVKGVKRVGTAVSQEKGVKRVGTAVSQEKGVKRVGTAVSQEKGVKRVGTAVSQEKGVKRVGTAVSQEKGVKRVGTAVSQEKGGLLTVCGTINAMGGFIPPFCIFPGVNTQPLWEEVLPINSKAEGHAKASGWMTGDNFFNYLKHFHKYARPSKELPVLLLLDNHASHVSLAVINYCKENDIVLLSFPPHCSHELQPLDKTVYGPLKTLFF